jgi:threonine-phosphate decarboxylase
LHDLLNPIEEKGILMSIVHGGNVYEVALQLGCPPESILDFSASINPLGPPPGLEEKFNQYYRRLQSYPDINNRDLVEAAARFHECHPNQIAVGNGSTELLYWLPKALNIRKALVILPTFGEYPKAFELQSVQLDKLITLPQNHFQPTAEQLEAVCASSSPEAILITHPGSPSGTLLTPEVRTWLLRKSRKEGVFCIVDEVFIDFCEKESFKNFLKETPQLILIRSMTKFYGIPGLRLGYILASESVAGRLRYYLPPWSVNTLAQIAGVFCFEQETYQRKTLELIAQEREKFSSALESTKGLKVFPGKANYLLIEMDEAFPPAVGLRRDLLQSNRILIRDCSSFEGMGNHYARLAIRLPEENQRLLEALILWVNSYVS